MGRDIPELAHVPAIRAFTASAREDGRLRPYVLTRYGGYRFAGKNMRYSGVPEWLLLEGPAHLCHR